MSSSTISSYPAHSHHAHYFQQPSEFSPYHAAGGSVHKDREPTASHPPPPQRQRRSSSTSSYTYTSYSSSSFSGQRKMTNTVRASNKSAILAVGEELRLLLHDEDPPIIKSRRYHLRVYENCFVGHDMVDWLLKKGEVESRKEAVAMMQKLLDNGVIHHEYLSLEDNLRLLWQIQLCDDHYFKDEKLFFRFRKDDGTYEEPADSAIVAKGQRIYSRLRSDGSNLIQDRRYHLASYKQCFVGRDLVDWLIARGEATSRPQAIDLGRQLLEAGVFRHVCDDHHFKDEHLFFRFKNDEKGKGLNLRDRLNSKKSSKRSRPDDDTNSVGDSSDHRASGSSFESVSVGGGSHSPDQDEYVHMQSHQPVAKQPSPLLSRSVPSPSPQPSPILSHTPSQTSIKSNGAVSGATSTASTCQPGMIVRPTVEELVDPNGLYTKRRIDVTSDPVGYGFVIRGSRPVYVHTVDPNGPAAAARLQVGEYLYSVNGQNVLNASHTDAARIILMGSSTASLVTFVEKDRLSRSA